MLNARADKLGGRLPLPDPHRLFAAQAKIYNRVNTTFVSWADRVKFRAKTEDGRLIGPFNPMLYSPEIANRFLDLHDTEEKRTSLDERVRQVVIITVGAVWKSDYEIYAHSAAAREAGLTEDAIQSLAIGRMLDDLSDQEVVAQRYAHQLAAEHRVEECLYQAAVDAFGERGVVDLTFLVGIYHITCGLLNSFDIPTAD